MAKDTMFSSKPRRKRRHDYRNASIGPNMGGYDAKGNTHTARSVKKTKPQGAHAVSDGQAKRRTRSFTPGEIGYVNPRTSSGETVADFSRRRSRKARAAIKPQSDFPLRTVAFAVAAVLLAILVAAGVASCVFNSSVNSRLALQDTAVADALVKPESAEDPYYALLAGEFPDPGQADDGPDVLMLVRVVPREAKATVVSIPSNLIWTLSDGSNAFISQERVGGGDAGLVRTVAGFAGVDIAHFAKVDAEGFVSLVDALGGIEVELSEEVDDPEAGSIYVPSGNQVLGGDQALVVCRAKNYLGSYDTRAQNQMKVLLALVQKAASAEGPGARQGVIDAMAGTFETDLSTGDLAAVLDQFADVSVSDVQMARVPGYSGYEGGELRFSVAPNAWKAMMEKVDSGGDPNEKSEAVQSVDPSAHTVTVKNGSGVTGAANQAKDALEAVGYKVTATGNTDQFAYGETLVVYKDEANEAVAEAVVDALGVGRAIEAGIYYDFDTDIQVIVGQDFKGGAL